MLTDAFWEHHLKKKIDKLLKNDWEKQINEIKILLLDAGESGKSTIFKQIMKILHLNGFYQEEKLKYTTQVTCA